MRMTWWNHHPFLHISSGFITSHHLGPQGRSPQFTYPLFPLLNAGRSVFKFLGFRKPPVVLGVEGPTWNLFSHFARNPGSRSRLRLLYSSQKGFPTGVLVAAAAAAALPILFISSSGSYGPSVNILFAALHVLHFVF